jgi:hypothetical protein
LTFLSLNFSAAPFLRERARQARFQSPLLIKIKSNNR